MILYHGSPNRFEKFLTPRESGIIRKSEEGRSRGLDHVFVTPRLDIAEGYAGKSGYIYELDISEKKLVSLAETKKRPSKRKKVRAKYTGDVFLVKPEHIRITSITKG
jgi:hypothetical protein